jgi:uncharacterized protein (DUF2252 family)
VTEVTSNPALPLKNKVRARIQKDLSTRAERYRAGKALRSKIPRSSHSVWVPPRDRPDIVNLLKASDGTRLANLLPIRYGRMAFSPFGFLRGAAVVMARDLTGTPVTGLHVQLAGDAHVSNFGFFATPERDQVFDSNDFDETIPGPWEWDLKRLSTSLVLVSRMRGFPDRVARKAAKLAARSYRNRMHSFAQMRYLETWYVHLDKSEVIKEIERKGQRLFREEAEKARERTEFHSFPKIAKITNGRALIRDVPPLIVHYQDPSEEAAIRTVFENYRTNLPKERRMLLDRYHLEDIAQKVVGIGSVGTRCAVGLFLGDQDLLDPIFLQVKEAIPSVYEPYLGPSPYANHAERVVVGQRLVQHASDIFLGWGSSGSHDFYVRQLHDMRFSADITALGPKALFGQAELCGAALARAHARTGDPAFIAGYLGEGNAFDDAMVGFAEAYATQTETDHATLVKAISKGRLAAIAPSSGLAAGKKPARHAK